MTKWTTQSVKEFITQELQKVGESLEELEQVIKKAQLEKKAISNPINLFAPIAQLANLGGTVAVGLGAVGGAGLYGAYQANQHSSDEQLKRIKERQDYEEATKQLALAYAQAKQEAGQ